MSQEQPSEMNGAEVLDIVHMPDLDTFVRALTAWHSQKMEMLRHLQDIPEGTAFQVGDGTEAKDLVMTAEMLDGFQFGIEMALMQIGELPFVVEIEDAQPQPADAAAG